MDYKKKYLKYKLKYLTAKKLYGGSDHYPNKIIYKMEEDIKKNFEKKTTVSVKEALKNLEDIGIQGRKAEDIIWLTADLYNDIDSKEKWKNFVKEREDIEKKMLEEKKNAEKLARKAKEKKTKKKAWHLEPDAIKRG